MHWVSLALAAVVAGPPKLPPMPGKSAPEPTPVTAKLPSQPKPAPAKPEPSKPEPSKPAVAPAVTPSPAAAPTAAAPTSPDVPPPAFVPPNEVPPQPEPTTGPPPRDGAGASPSMRPRGEPTLPGGDEAPAKKLPPPLRPPYRGIGLFVGAGVTFAVALTEQIVSHAIVKRRCIEPVAEQAEMTDPFDDDTDAEEIGNAILQCVPGVLPVVALRVNSDLALVAMIGMATAGAILRAERAAYDDAFAGRINRRIPKLRGAGVGLIALGAVTWLTLGPASWGVLAKCDDAKCAGGARVMGFTSRTIGAAIVAAGAGMLGFAEGYRRKHEHFSRERALLWAPSFGRGMVGVTVQQRF